MHNRKNFYPFILWELILNSSFVSIKVRSIYIAVYWKKDNRRQSLKNARKLVFKICKCTFNYLYERYFDPQNSHIIEKFVKNEFWKEKPKLFFFQACQGTTLDLGMERLPNYIAGTIYLGVESIGERTKCCKISPKS